MRLPESLATGYPDVDAEHARILEELQRLRAAGAPGIPMLIAFLREHVHQHFADEERLMDDLGYPDAEGHKVEHRRYASAVVMLEAQIERNKDAPESLAAVTALLEGLVIDHVMRTDYKLADFIQERRGSKASPPAGSGTPSP